MSEISVMMEKVNINNLVSYFTYGQDSSAAIVKDYEKCIEDSYYKLFGRLEKLASNMGRHNDEVFSAIMNFSITHNEVYLQMGLLIGFQLFNTLEQEFKGFKAADIDSIIKKYVNASLEKGITE